MPFQLPDYDEAFARFLHARTYELACSRSPLLGQIEMRTSSSTASSIVEGRDLPRVDLASESVGFGITMDLNAVRSGDVDALVIEIDKGSEELGRQLVQMFVGTMDKVTDATGNTLDAGGKPFTFDLFYEMLDRIEWNLTEDDELSMPQLVMHPDMAAKLPQLTDEQQAALDALKQRKHEELLARRRRRRLS